MPRADLASLVPTDELVTAHRQVLAQWLAARYRRAALPDAFEHRLKKAKTVNLERLGEMRARKRQDVLKKERNLQNSLLKVAEKDGASIEGIYLALGGSEYDELPSDKPYLLTLVVVGAVDGCSPAQAEANASAVAEKIRDLFDNAEWSVGEIQLQACHGTSEETFSLYEYRRMLRWNFDWLSLEDDPTV